MRKPYVWSSLLLGVFLALTSSRAQALAPCFTARAERIIDAPYDLVFDTIVDTASYPEWNPYIVEVTPAGVDVSEVGAEFVLNVDQPFQLFNTQSPEKTSAVVLPDGTQALLAYRFNSPLAGLVGNPVRVQRFTALSATRTRYVTEETFCTLLLPLLPLASVQTGFTLQAIALEREAEARFSAQSLPR